MSLYISTNFSCLKTIRSVDNNYYFYQNINPIFRPNTSPFEEINNRIKQINIGKKYFVHPKINCVSNFRKDRINVKSVRETKVQAGYIRHSSFGDIIYSPVSRHFNHIQQIVIYSLFSINTAMLFEYHNIKYMKEEVFPMSSRIFLKEFIPQILQNNHLNISLDMVMSETVFDELQKIQKNIKNYQPLSITDNIIFGRISINLEEETENISLETLFIKYFEYYIRVHEKLKNNIVFILLPFLIFECIKKIQNIKITNTTIQIQKVRPNLEKLKIYYFSDFNVFILKCKIGILFEFERSLMNNLHILSIINKDNTYLYYEYKTTNLNSHTEKEKEYKDIIKIPSKTIIHLPENINQNQETKYTLQDIYQHLVQEVHKSNEENDQKTI